MVPERALLRCMSVSPIILCVAFVLTSFTFRQYERRILMHFSVELDRGRCILSQEYSKLFDNLPFRVDFSSCCFSCLTMLASFICRSRTVDRAVSDTILDTSHIIWNNVMMRVPVDASEHDESWYHAHGQSGTCVTQVDACALTFPCPPCMSRNKTYVGMVIKRNFAECELPRGSGRHREQGRDRAQVDPH